MEDFKHGLKHLGGCGFDSRSPDFYCKSIKGPLMAKCNWFCDNENVIITISE